MRKILSIILSVAMILGTLTVLTALPAIAVDNTSATVSEPVNLVVNGDANGVDGVKKYTQTNESLFQVKDNPYGWYASDDFNNTCRIYTTANVGADSGFYSNYSLPDSLWINRWRQALQDIKIEDNKIYKVSAVIAGFPIQTSDTLSGDCHLYIDTNVKSNTSGKYGDHKNKDWYATHSFEYEVCKTVTAEDGTATEYQAFDFQEISFTFNSHDFITDQGLTDDDGDGKYDIRLVVGNSSNQHMLFDDVKFYEIIPITAGIEAGSENGGYVDVPTEKYSSNASVTFKAVPYFGNTFEGWFNADGKLVSSEAIFTSATHLELYARFGIYNLIKDGGFDGSSLGDTSPAAMENNVIRDTSYAPTYEVVSNTENTDILGDRVLKYHSTASENGKGSGTSDYDVTIPVTVKKNTKYIFKVLYKSTNSTNVGFTIMDNVTSGSESNAVLTGYSRYFGVLGTKTTNTWGVGTTESAILSETGWKIVTPTNGTANSTYSDSAWNEFYVLFDSLEYENLYLVIGIQGGTTRNPDIYLDNIQLTELTEYSASGSYEADGGYYTVTNESENVSGYQFATNTPGSAITYDDVIYLDPGADSAGAHKATYSAQPYYGNGFIGWSDGKTIVSNEWIYSCEYALTPVFDQKNLIKNGDFETVAGHQAKIDEINGYSVYHTIAQRGTPSIVSTDGLLNTGEKYGDYALKLTPAASGTYKTKNLICIPVTVKRNTNYIWRFSYKFDDNAANFNAASTHQFYSAINGIGTNGKIPWNDGSSTIKWTYHSQQADSAVDTNNYLWGGGSGFTAAHVSDNASKKQGYWQDYYVLFNANDYAAVFTDSESEYGTVYLSLGTVATTTDFVLIDNMSVCEAVEATDDTAWSTLSAEHGETYAYRMGTDPYNYSYTPYERGNASAYTGLESTHYLPAMYTTVKTRAAYGYEFVGWREEGTDTIIPDQGTAPLYSIGKTYEAVFSGTGADEHMGKVGYGYASYEDVTIDGELLRTYTAEPYYNNNFTGWYDENGIFVSSSSVYTTSLDYLEARFEGYNMFPNGDFEHDDSLDMFVCKDGEFSVTDYETVQKQDGHGDSYLKLSNSIQRTTDNAIVLPVEKDTEYLVTLRMKPTDFGINGYLRLGFTYEVGNLSAGAKLGSATQSLTNPETGHTRSVTTASGTEHRPDQTDLYYNDFLTDFDGEWINVKILFNSGSDTNVFKNGSKYGNLYLMLMNFNNGMTVMVDNIVFATKTDVVANAEEGGIASADLTSVIPGNDVTFTAVPDYGARFKGWYYGNRRVSVNKVFTTNEYTSLTARFEDYNLIKDGGFEGGTFGGFTPRTSNNAVTFENIAHTDTVDAEYGSRMLKATVKATDSLDISLPIEAEANTKYHIHFSYKFVGDSAYRTDITLSPTNGWNSFKEANGGSSKFYASNTSKQLSKSNMFDGYTISNYSTNFGDGFVEMNIIVDTGTALTDGNMYLLLGAWDSAKVGLTSDVIIYIDNLSVTKMTDIAPQMLGASLFSENGKYAEGTVSYISKINYTSPSLGISEVGTFVIPTQLIPEGTEEITLDTVATTGQNVSVAKIKGTDIQKFDTDVQKYYATFRNTHSIEGAAKISARSYFVLTDKYGNSLGTFYSENESESAKITNGTYNRSLNQIKRLIARNLVNTFAGNYPDDFFSSDDVGPNDNVASSASTTIEEVWNFVKRNVHLLGENLDNTVQDGKNLIANGDFEDTAAYLGAQIYQTVDCRNDETQKNNSLEMISNEEIWKTEDPAANNINPTSRGVIYMYDPEGWTLYTGNNPGEYVMQPFVSWAGGFSSYFSYADYSSSGGVYPHSGDSFLKLNTRYGIASYMLQDLKPNTDYELSFYWNASTDDSYLNFAYVYPYLREYSEISKITERGSSWTDYSRIIDPAGNVKKESTNTNYANLPTDGHDYSTKAEHLAICEVCSNYYYSYFLHTLAPQEISVTALELESRSLAYVADPTYTNKEWQKVTIKFNSDQHADAVLGIRFDTATGNNANFYIDDLSLVETSVSETAKDDTISNRVSNGDFKNGMQDWEGTASTYKIGGSSSATLNNYGNSIRQTVGVKNRTAYTMTVKAKAEDADSLYMGITKAAHDSLSPITVLTSSTHKTVGGTDGIAEYTIDFNSADNDFINLHLSSLSDKKVTIYSVTLEETEELITLDTVDFENSLVKVTNGHTPGDADEDDNGIEMAKDPIKYTNTHWYQVVKYASAHSGNNALLMRASRSYSGTETEEALTAGENINTKAGETLVHPMYQSWAEFNITPGTQYELSYWVKAASGSSSYESSVRTLEMSDWDYLQALDKQTVNATTAWQKVTHHFYFNPKESSYEVENTVNLVFSANDGTTADLYFDDIVFKKAQPRIETDTPSELYTEWVYNLIPNDTFDSDKAEESAVYTSQGGTITADGTLSVTAGTKIVIPIETRVEYNHQLASLYTFAGKIKKSTASSAGYVGISYTADGNGLYLKADGTANGSVINATLTGWGSVSGFSYISPTVTPTYLVIECTAGTIEVDDLALFTNMHAFETDPNEPSTAYDYNSAKNLEGAIKNGGTAVSGAVSLKVTGTVASPYFTGAGKTVHHAVVSDVMGRDYSEEQLELELTRFANAGVKSLRTMFRSQWAYTGDTDKPWDWGSDEMLQFYAWCNKAAEYGIEIIPVISWAQGGISMGATSIPEVAYLYPLKLDNDGNVQYTISWGNLHRVVDREVLAQRYADYATGAMLAFIEHGVTNINYILTFNEPSHTNGTLDELTYYDNGTVKTDASEGGRPYTWYWGEGPYAMDIWNATHALNQKMKSTTLDDGTTLRDKYMLIGPNQGNTMNAGLAGYILYMAKEAGYGNDGYDFYDVWSSHYVHSSLSSGVESDMYNKASKVYQDMICHQSLYNDDPDENYDFRYTAMEKPFWLDEYNTAGYKYVRDGDSDEVQRWWGVSNAGQYTAMMNAGISGGILWQFSDALWSYSCGDGGDFQDGFHMTGSTRSIMRSLTPYYIYYSTTLLTKYMSSSTEATSYVGTSGHDNIHISAVKFEDGNWSVLVVNNSESQQNINVALSNSVGGKTMYRHAYIASEVTPTSEAKIIEPDKVFTNVTTAINDTIPAGSVIVYTSIAK